MMASVETRRDTGFLLSAGTGLEGLRSLGDGSADQSGFNGAVGPVTAVGAMPVI
jgi:hypothetical protein